MNEISQEIKIFADGADIAGMLEMYRSGVVRVFTTNPTLMKKANVTDYGAFARAALAVIPDMPISFEVFASDFSAMETEAHVIGGWGKNVYIKIPILNAQGESSVPLIRSLSAEGLKINVTAVLTYHAAQAAVDAISPGVGAIISVFCGRIADTGVDPVPLMRDVAALCKAKAGVESLWASTREVYNILQARDAKADIVTVTNDILKKLNMLDMDLYVLSLDTVRMFDRDAKALGFHILQ
jgi:transaldolase